MEVETKKDVIFSLEWPQNLLVKLFSRDILPFSHSGRAQKLFFQ